MRICLVSVVVVVFPVFTFYFLEKVQELREAERRAAAVGLLDVEPTAAPVLPTYRR
ncbi:MAG: hypothetical protein IAE97_02585 [Chthoniobacterales bacterium]|nr:hypothetical protein [Chthoniobacterales bacterium]